MKTGGSLSNVHKELSRVRLYVRPRKLDLQQKDRIIWHSSSKRCHVNIMNTTVVIHGFTTDSFKLFQTTTIII